MPDSERVLREPGAAAWRVEVGGRQIGETQLLTRPDGRGFLLFRSAEAAAYRPLVNSIREETSGPLSVMLAEDEDAALDALTGLGFEPARRESEYAIPVAEAATRLRGADLPVGYTTISVADVPEDELRVLDDALRQDVPGLDGWQWDAAGFRDETYETPALDPELYAIAVHEPTGESAGLVRIWNNPAAPRLGLIAVLAPHRRRGLARGLLAQVFDVLARRGAEKMLTEVDDLNVASRTLVLGLGGRRVGGLVELVHRP